MKFRLFFLPFCLDFRQNKKEEWRTFAAGGKQTKGRARRGLRGKKIKACLRARIVFKKFKNYSYFFIKTP